MAILYRTETIDKLNISTVVANGQDGNGPQLENFKSFQFFSRFSDKTVKTDFG